mmetsp:Transcript_30343/g.69515  ORF Transcript_30343/g.69515 Transcript_30343/m.69515 type:complete len:257 (-) Transcript_30343:45-815(-)
MFYPLLKRTSKIMNEGSHTTNLIDPTDTKADKLLTESRRETTPCSEIEPLPSQDLSDEKKVAEILVSMSADDAAYARKKTMIASRKKMILDMQRQLLHLHRAATCATLHDEQLFETRRGRVRPRECSVCPASCRSDCASFKRLWAHMYTCSEGTRCRHRQCVVAKKILFYYRNCVDKRCPVCIPVRNAIYRKNVVKEYYVNFSEKAACIPSRVREATDSFENDTRSKMPREAMVSLDRGDVAASRQPVTFGLNSFI